MFRLVGLVSECVRVAHIHVLVRLCAVRETNSKRQLTHEHICIYTDVCVCVWEMAVMGVVSTDGDAVIP